jgi:hypothetical protein
VDGTKELRQRMDLQNRLKIEELKRQGFDDAALKEVIEKVRSNYNKKL